MANVSNVLEFALVAFPGLPERFYSAVATALFCIYSISVCANATVIALVVLRERLHQPMYINIANLAISDILFDTATLPKMMAKYWFGDGSLSFSACFFQMTLVHTLNTHDSLTILLMAYDRYVAVCNPLRYHSIITKRGAAILCLIAWLLAAGVGLRYTSWAIPLPFCGPNRIRNFYCSLMTVALLACTDSSEVRKNGFYAGIIVHMGPLSLIVLSYIVMIANIGLSARLDSWKKTLHTCIANWFVMIVFYVPRIVDYAYQAQVIPNADVIVFMISIYSYVPHFSSPIIFCLRNKEIKRNLETTLRKLFVLR